MGFSPQGELDYAYARPFEIEGAPWVEKFAAFHGHRAEVTCLPYEPDFLLYGPDGEPLKGDFKAQRDKGGPRQDVCIEVMTPDYRDSWGVTYNRVLTHLGRSGDWLWTNLDRLNEPGLFKQLPDPVQVKSSGSWVVWASPTLLKSLKCTRVVTEQVRAAYKAVYGDTPPQVLYQREEEQKQLIRP